VTLSEEQYAVIAAAVMSDEAPITVTISIKDAWILIGVLQLAHRHPGLGRLMKNAVKRYADQFSDPIIGRHPEARALIRHGWNPAYDVEIKEKKD
jgi:hypothetical protein